jgi:hypothetical protein
MTKTQGYAFLWLLVLPLALAACARSDAGASAAEPPAAAAQSPGPAADSAGPGPGLSAFDRKVIKIGSLALTVDDPVVALTDARRIAEQHGGYLLTSSNSAPAHADEDAVNVSVSLKVRADRFDAALSELRRLGSGTGSESIESKDVSEEYVDADARLRTQKRVEEQYLTLLKDAKNVTETLEVHKQLTLVRTEIERLEGKLRLLEHQVRLSTINVTLEKKRPLLSISGGRFGRAVRQAGVDAVNVGAAIVVFTIRATGVFIPFAVLLLLPGFFALRWASRRFAVRRAPS